MWTHILNLHSKNLAGITKFNVLSTNLITEAGISIYSFPVTKNQRRGRVRNRADKLPAAMITISQQPGRGIHLFPVDASVSAAWALHKSLMSPLKAQ